MAGFSLQSLFIGIVTGFVPTFFWLYFWLKETEEIRYPLTLVLLVFGLGGIGVFLAIPLQSALSTVFAYKSIGYLMTLACVEEIVKFLLVCIAVPRILTPRLATEPAVFLVSAALGFAAVENTLFLLNPVLHQNINLTLVTGNLRFLGSTVLHAICAAFIGIGLGLAATDRFFSKMLHLLTGLALAVALHGLFNYFIIRNDTKVTMTTLGVLWALTLVVIIIFESLKLVHHQSQLRRTALLQ